MAKLTAEEREILINALVENEAIEEDDREAFEGLKDTKLIAIADAVLNADEESEEEDDDEDEEDSEDIVDNEDSDEEDDEDEEDEEDEEEDGEELATNKKKIPPQFLKHMKKKGGKSAAEEDEEDDEEPATNTHVCNMCAGHMKGKKGKKGKYPVQEESEDMTGNMTTEEWMNSAPPEIAEVVANAMKFANDEKAKLIEQLTANSSGTAKVRAVKLFAQHSLEDLRAIAPALTQNTQRATVTHVPGLQARSFSGAASPGVTTNRAKKTTESQPLIMPTLNWKEVSDEFAGRN